MRKTTEKQHDDDSRLGQLETFTTRLGTQQEGFRYELHEVKKAVEGLAAEMRAFMSSKSRTNWSVLTGFGSLLLMISGLAAAPFYRDLGRLEERAGKGEAATNTILQHLWTRADQDAFMEKEEEERVRMEEWVRTHSLEFASIHSRQTEKLSDLEQRVQRLTDKLDAHEATDGHAAMRERVESLERRVAP